jgi:type III protein arginine methyltransferase
MRLMAELKDKIAALESRVQGYPAAMLGLARMLQEDGQSEKALAMCRAALAQAPDDAQLAAKVRSFISSTVPQWHFNLVRDDARNAAYETALRQAVTPTSRVLEIGTGTGLLAMMAARAGAAAVVTCEVVPAIAEKAAEIVARNGYGDRVRVVAKHSDRLDAEADMGGHADILVSEIVANNFLAEGVLPAHERAVRDLLKPGGRVIPARGTVRVALAHDSGHTRSLTQIAGFDLSAFNDLVQPIRRIIVGDGRLTLKSDPVDLFVFDLASARYCAPAQASVACRSAGGEINGVVQWIALELDETTHYENRPGVAVNSAWAVVFHAFQHSIDTAPGQELQIYGAHDRNNLTIWT